MHVEDALSPMPAEVSANHRLGYSCSAGANAGKKTHTRVASTTPALGPQQLGHIVIQIRHSVASH